MDAGEHPGLAPLEGKVERVRQALLYLLWGGVIVFFDLKFNGFDVVNDVIGMVFILVAVSRLRDAPVRPVSERYEGFMTFVLVMTWVQLVMSILEVFGVTLPAVLSVLISIANFVAVLFFCASMQDLLRACESPESSESWRTTFLFFAVLWGLLTALQIVGVLVAWMTGPFNVESAVAFLFVVAAFVPLVHLAVSVVRTRAALAG